MATLNNGILGGGRNKVGPVIMSKWKGINYIRAYAVPSNPNTAAQQAVRTKFAQLVLNGRQILSTILKPYWDPFYTTKSGFNAFIGENYNRLGTGNIFDSDCVLAKGSLTNISSVDCTYNPSTGVITVEWDAPGFGDILPSDMVSFAVYDQASKNFIYSSTPDEVSAVGTSLTVLSGLTASNLRVYYFTSRGSGSSLAVSDSNNVVCHT